jgi:hypothetical protein
VRFLDWSSPLSSIVKKTWEGDPMQKLALTLVAMVELLAAGLSRPAQAMMPVEARAAQSMANNLPLAETVACYGYGWRGWGVYPGWYPACNRVVYGAPAYAAPAPVYAAPVYAAPAYPSPRQCWVQASDGNGYWTAC